MAADKDGCRFYLTYLVYISVFRHWPDFGFDKYFFVSVNFPQP